MAMIQSMGRRTWRPAFYAAGLLGTGSVMSLIAARARTSQPMKNPLNPPVPPTVPAADGKVAPKEPRRFPADDRRTCWDQAKDVPGRSSKRWKQDRVGNVYILFHGCNGPMCYQYDHMDPYISGGKSKAWNCQVLQSVVNKAKGDRKVSDKKLWLSSYAITHTDAEMDSVEMNGHGDIRDPDDNIICKVYKNRDEVTTTTLPPPCPKEAALVALLRTQKGDS